MAQKKRIKNLDMAQPAAKKKTKVTNKPTLCFEHYLAPSGEQTRPPSEINQSATPAPCTACSWRGGCPSLWKNISEGSSPSTTWQFVSLKVPTSLSFVLNHYYLLQLWSQNVTPVLCPYFPTFLIEQPLVMITISLQNP